jgi:hypothetical protein
MKVIKNLNPYKEDSLSNCFKEKTYFYSFIKHLDFFIFGFGSYSDFDNGIAVYDKDLNMVNTFESKRTVSCMMSIDN